MSEIHFLFSVVNEVLGINDTIIFNGEIGGSELWRIETECDSLVIKSSVVGNSSGEWFRYKIIETGLTTFFVWDLTLNHPTKTGNVDLVLEDISNYTDTIISHALELRKVLVTSRNFMIIT